jgi:hypothetical protein
VEHSSEVRVMPHRIDGGGRVGVPRCMRMSACPRNSSRTRPAGRLSAATCSGHWIRPGDTGLESPIAQLKKTGNNGPSPRS